MPIYHTIIMVMWIASGMIIFDEAKYYSQGKLWAFVGALLLCCIGIKFLTIKTKNQRREQREVTEATGKEETEE